MAIPTVDKTYADIKALRVQGAVRVALAAVAALGAAAQQSRARTVKEFETELQKGAHMLLSARPTEPALRNGLRFLIAQARKQKFGSVAEGRAFVARLAERFKQEVLAQQAKIAKIGAREISSGDVILTHCHSNNVMNVLREAAKRKDIRVICTESRPLYQGRITAAELAAAHIPVTMVVDNAVHTIMHQANVDMVMVGADAITSSGDLINKIGTSIIALCAYDHDIPFYSVSGSHKFDPLTLWGAPEPIEKRPAAELGWSHGGVKILNPAFDVTKARFISAYITELGVIPPQSLTMAAWEAFGLGRR